MTGENSVKVESVSASEEEFSNPKNPNSDEKTKMQTAAMDETQPIEAPGPQTDRPESMTNGNTSSGPSGSHSGFQVEANVRSPNPGVSEIQAAEKSLDRRRLDLDRQTQLLAGRLQQLFEREQRVAGLEAEKRQLEEEKKEVRSLREELDNLKEIMDLEFTGDRKILVQERLQIARMREALRLERERFESEVSLHRNRKKPD